MNENLSERRFRVLVVEDDRCLSQALFRSLKLELAREETLDMDWVTNVADATVALSTQAYHLVITDYQLPNLRTGLEVVRAAKESATAPPCILISGMPLAELLEVSRDRMHGVPILPKPFSVKELRVLIRNARPSAFKEAA